jgi:PEGA domain
MRYRAVLAAWVALSVVAVGHPADARGRPKKEKEDPVTQQAREAFRAGTAAVKAGQWSEALVQFEKANELKGAPIITFNIGYCQRALGRYVQARLSFRKVLDDSEGLPQAQLEEARTFLEQIDSQVLARVKITLKPASARVAIDGRPLVPFEGVPGLLVAGLAPAGEGKPPPKSVFEVVIDPGVHLIQASRPGHEDVLVNKTFAPNARETLSLELDVLPATIHVESDQQRAVVLVDDRDVGLAPIDVTRPAGTYRIQVLKKGFVTYDSTLELTPGQKANLTARMVQEEESITKKWWFWGGAAAIVAGGVTATYFLTRPDPQPPDYQGGSLDWVAQPR